MQTTLRLLLLLLFTFVTLPVNAQQLAQLKPQVDDLMKRFEIPGASLAVVSDGKIVWTEGFGEADTNTGRAVKPNTLFQAASLSKPVAAWAALRLVDARRMGLDEPIGKSLKGNKSLKAIRPNWGRTATLRQLLSHTSGLSVHGFPGYAKGTRLPTLTQVLYGSRPANTRRVVQDRRSGAFRYSGGGYCAVQFAIMSVAEDSFPNAMSKLALKPLAMADSTYEQPLPDRLAAAAATGHDDQSKPIRGKWHTYPEMAAAGLWTTSRDMARYVLAVQAAWEGSDETQLRQATAKQMLVRATPKSAGLGLFVYNSAAGSGFAHTGSNRGFRCMLKATSRRKNGFGMVIMTNSENGQKLFGPLEDLIKKQLKVK